MKLSPEFNDRLSAAIKELHECGTEIIRAFHCSKVVYRITVPDREASGGATVNINVEVPTTTSGSDGVFSITSEDRRP